MLCDAGFIYTQNVQIIGCGGRQPLRGPYMKSHVRLENLGSWKPKNMGHLPRKVTSSKHSQARSNVIWPGELLGKGLPRYFNARLKPCASYARNGPVDWGSLWPHHSSLCFASPLRMGTFPTLSWLEICNLLDFTGAQI